MPKRSLFSRSKRTGRYWFLRIIRQRATPENLGRGMALGVFIGAMPIIPFQSVTVILLAFVLRTNKLAAWLATCYSNPLTMIPFYSFLFMVGKMFYPAGRLAFDASRLEMESMIAAGWDFFLVMLVGGLVVGVPAAAATYFVTVAAVRRFRRLKAERMLKRRQERDALPPG